MQEFSFDATLQNLLPAAIGTPDGAEIVGSKVFFLTPPVPVRRRAPADTGTVHIKNGDGADNFTAPNQRYYTYAGVIPPQHLSSAKRWIFHVPRSITSFAFSVQVHTATPLYLWVPEEAPANTARWVFADSNIIRDSSGFGPVARNALMVAFELGATVATRRSAIAKVGGVVVGGVPLVGTEGFYLVKPSAGATIPQLIAAADAVAAMPGVSVSVPALVSDSIRVDK